MNGPDKNKTPETLESLSGRIERITFTNEENGYTVMHVKLPRQKNLLTVVGNLSSPVVGEFIEMEGSFVNSPNYGRQFKISKHRLMAPTTEPALKKYLGSGLIKGLGPVLAGRLVDRFGDKTLDVLEKTPERLTEVEGLGANRRESIIDAWRKASGMKRLMSFLAEFGVGPAVAMRIIRRLGDGADELIREDPYRLAYEVSGVGFATADKVAKTIGLKPDSPRRLEASLLFALSTQADEGHVFCPDAPLIKQAAALTPEAGEEALWSALGRLILEGRVKSEPQMEPGGANDIYLPKLNRAENWVAQDLLGILHTRPLIEVPRLEKALEWAESSLGLNLSEGQREAARLALEKKALIITGGPGTGKTTITRIITTIFSAVKAKIALVAPTGRAAKRLSTATGLPAKTVHRLLEYSPLAGGFMRGPKNKLDVDVLLVDEASMVDIQLMNQLVGALPHQARLIMVGDQDQLPSVGPGRVLADMMESGTIAVARLNDIYRQAQGSQIILAAHQVRQGLFPESSPDRDNGDFYFIEENDPAQVLSKIVYLVSRKIPDKFGLDPMEDIQVLTPMHNRDLGTESLNQVLSDTLNPSAAHSVQRFGRKFKLGDRVMQLRNNYNRDVFNGDSGRVEKIETESQELSVNFEGRSVIYDFADLDELTLSYAVTIHKSQGSEFPVVIIPMVKSHYIMLRRNLLYTAITRGRRFVVVIGSTEAVRKAVSTDHELKRHSRLALKLSGQGRALDPRMLAHPSSR
ncbi:ATP-dependent RecD-like DNA helicase [Deltaproteobacteria bacterium Smac51]|nr:ATP-dependent RecD-like DNA helicase [Deltaproteobacteria bacterium Smac51]